MSVAPISIINAIGVVGGTYKDDQMAINSIVLKIMNKIIALHSVQPGRHQTNENLFKFRFFDYNVICTPISMAHNCEFLIFLTIVNKSIRFSIKTNHKNQLLPRT